MGFTVPGVDSGPNIFLIKETLEMYYDPPSAKGTVNAIPSAVHLPVCVVLQTPFGPPGFQDSFLYLSGWRLCEGPNHCPL